MKKIILGALAVCLGSTFVLATARESGRILQPKQLLRLTNVGQESRETIIPQRPPSSYRPNVKSEGKEKERVFDFKQARLASQKATSQALSSTSSAEMKSSSASASQSTASASTVTTTPPVTSEDDSISPYVPPTPRHGKA